MAAAAICLARGIEPDAVRSGLSSFAGVEHRLEEVATIDGVLYVNDSKATNVASTLVALESFDAPIRLILGGQGKGEDYTPLREPVARRCAGVYLIGEEAEPLGGASVGGERCETLERALDAAAGAARPGEVVLLSPACASLRPVRGLRGPGTGVQGDGGGATNLASEMRVAARAKPKPKLPLEYNLLLTATLCLLALGAVMVYSASSARTLLQGDGDGTTYLVRYLAYGGVGFVALHVIARRGLDAVVALTGPLLAASFVCLVAVKLPGLGVRSTVRGAGSVPGRWSSSPPRWPSSRSSSTARSSWRTSPGASARRAPPCRCCWWPARCCCSSPPSPTSARRWSSPSR